MYLYNALTCSRSFRMKVMIPSTMITLAPYMHCCTHTHTPQETSTISPYTTPSTRTTFVNCQCALSSVATSCGAYIYCIWSIIVTVLWCYDTNHATHYLRTRTEMKHTHINDHTRTVYQLSRHWWWWRKDLHTMFPAPCAAHTRMYTHTQGNHHYMLTNNRHTPFPSHCAYPSLLTMTRL